jgi:8-oxo-dGTP diphosphatase
MTDFEPPDIAVTVDTVVFTERGGEPLVVLVERGNDPYLGSWALPGGFVETEEDLAEAAARELSEETGLSIPAAALRQLGAYGEPGRDPRMRTVSIVFWARIPDPGDPVGGSDAASSSWVPVEEALRDEFAVAFDHDRILHDAWEAARP